MIGWEGSENTESQKGSIFIFKWKRPEHVLIGRS